MSAKPKGRPRGSARGHVVAHVTRAEVIDAVDEFGNAAYEMTGMLSPGNDPARERVVLLHASIKHAVVRYLGTTHTRVIVREADLEASRLQLSARSDEEDER